MKITFKILLFAFTLLFFTSCGGDKSIDYTEWVVGSWELKNAGELQRFLPSQNSYLLKNATISFAEDGTISAKLMKLDKRSWIEYDGTWEMPEKGEKINIKSNDGPFNDKLEIEFPDERTFFIKSNQLIYHFVKL